MVIVFCVWGAIVYQIARAISSGKGESIENVSNEINERIKSVSFVYTNDTRDPFQYVHIGHRDTSKISRQKTPSWIPPPMKLTGILSAGKKKTVMLEGQTGTVYFLHEGDTLNGIKILKIENKHVSYLFTKKKAIWTIDQP